MRENKHTMSDLYQMQSLPLDAKIRMTEYRINQWVEEFGTDGVYVSFSGGKDSTVLADIVRNRLGYNDIPLVFCDVPTQYVELKEFAETWGNLVVLKPKKGFVQICEQYGFPLVSKQCARYIEGARKWKKENPNGDIKNATTDYKIMYGKLEHKEKGVLTEEYSKIYDKSRWSFMVDAPFDTSPKCCHYLKKEPLKRYAKETGRKPMTGQMAEESHLRTMAWLLNGCNMFDSKEPMSNPMSFWKEQDVLHYIKKYNIKICSVYGDVVEDISGTDEVEGQMTISDIDGFENEKMFDAKKPKLKTTLCERTGCVLCGFGACSRGDFRFARLRETHPSMYNLLNYCKNNGMSMIDAMKWMNEYGGTDIKL